MPQDSPTSLWTLHRGTSVRECRAVFVGNRIEGQLLVNDSIIHVWVFPDGDSLARWAEDWRTKYLAEGWATEPNSQPVEGLSNGVIQ